MKAAVLKEPRELRPGDSLEALLLRSELQPRGRGTSPRVPWWVFS